ncbi:MAG TPA: undecaprenyl-diphosphatase UppP [Candidatus Acidoferrales bacterium]|nr:undecaprenyl-diphosphatase UppP [Candidatus Acidoferrales bacterium]
MLHLYQAILLAIIQGLTEFLPVSSTAHLILFPWLAGWPDPGLAFDVALHVGTLFAVLLYFLRDWTELIAAGLGFHYPRGASYEYIEHQRKMFWYLVAGTIPAAIVGVLFQHRIEDRQGESWYILAIAGALIAVGLLMWYGEYAGRLDRPMERVNFVDAVIIGLSQACALFPGVSRSGATITTGLFRGLTREAAARFSFILSTPIIAGAAVVELPKLMKMHRAGTLLLPMSTIAISVAVSAIVGMIVIAFFLRYLQVRTLKIFIYYRILLGIVILLLVFLHMGHA